MVRNALTWLSLCTLSAWLAGGAGVSADVLVTKGGSRYEGQVTQEGGTYVLVKPDGGRIVLPKSMVREVIRKAPSAEPAPAAGGAASPTPAPAGDPVKDKAFHLLGDFDLNGDGTCTQAERTKLIDLIRGRGGTVRDSLDGEVDILALGILPPQPDRPGADADLEARRRYDAELKAWASLKGWHDNHPGTLELRKLGIRRISHDRFLALLGADPRPPTSPGKELNGRCVHVLGRFEAAGRRFSDRQVEQAVRQRGGKVMRGVVPTTDILAVGTLPTRPWKPLGDVPKRAMEIYEMRRRLFGDPRQVLAMAETVYVTTMDAKAFLPLIGLAGDAAAEPAARPRGGATAAKQATLQKLERRIERFTFQDIAVKDAIQFLRDVGDMNVFVDWHMAVTVGVKPASPVTLSHRNISIEAGLRSVLGQAGRQKLAWEVDAAGIVIVSTAAGLQRLRLTGPQRWAGPGGTTPAVRRTVERLGRQLERLSFADIRLSDVLVFFGEYAQLSIHVDWEALKDSGAGPDILISMDLQKVPVHRPLELLIRTLSKGKAEVAIDPAGTVLVSSAQRLASAVRPCVWVPDAHPTLAQVAAVRKLKAEIDHCLVCKVELAEFVQAIARHVEVQIHADWQALKAAGITPETKVSLDSQRVPAATALRLCLFPRSVRLKVESDGGALLVPPTGGETPPRR